MSLPPDRRAATHRGHSQNAAFDQVVLHIFLYKGAANHFTRTTQNREVIQVHLQSKVDLLNAIPPIAHPGQCCAPLRQLSDKTIDDLIETMLEYDGAGLAAPQVHISSQIVVFEVEGNPRYPEAESIPLTVLINPKLTPVTAAMTITKPKRLSER